MNAQKLIPALIILCVALWVAYVSFTAQPAEGFAFPRLISVAFVALSATVVAQAVLVDGDQGEAITFEQVKRFLPGLVIAAIFVFWVAKSLGFYTGSAIATFVLIAVYDPAPHGAIMSWVKRAIITAAFMAVMYLLFAQALGVFTPKEVLFR
ncbi:MAG: tripartite tricarboxylate transporter TctB family protein [Pseudomonadota bacterium]